MTTWQSILAWLAALSADPAAIDAEAPKAAAAVAAAYASVAPETSPNPPPVKACPCGGTCKGSGQWKPDGRIVMRCEPPCSSCSMKSVLEAECPDGKCKPNSPAPSR